jgi:hypothetical protein
MRQYCFTMVAESGNNVCTPSKGVDGKMQQVLAQKNFATYNYADWIYQDGSLRLAGSVEVPVGCATELSHLFWS